MSLKKKYTIADFSMVYKDTFSWEWLYKMVHDWLADEGYSRNKSDKWTEENFIQRNLDWGKEIWVWWRTTKKRSKLITLHLHVDFHTLGLNDTEIMHEGKKIKCQKGEVEVFIKGELEFDAKDDLAKLPWMKYDSVKNWFEKRWYRGEIAQEEAKIYNDCYRLQNAVKQYFDLKGWIGEYNVEPFIPRKGR